jgi:ribosome-binding factor A
MERHRSERLSEAIREELEEIISYELSDPRIDAQGVSEVLISPDAKQARVRVILTGDARKQQETIEALNHARSYLKIQLGQRLDVYRIPELHFEAAIDADLGGRINHLLRRVKKGRPRDESKTGNGSEAQSGSSETPEKNQVP